MKLLECSTIEMRDACKAAGGQNAQTLSEAVRAYGMRGTWYTGQARTLLAHLMTAAAINVGRLLRWIAGEPKACMKRSSFERLFAALPEVGQGNSPPGSLKIVHIRVPG